MPTISLQVACLALAQLASEPQLGSSPSPFQPSARTSGQGRDSFPQSVSSPANSAAPSIVRPAAGLSNSRSQYGLGDAPAIRDPAGEQSAGSASLAQRLVDEVLHRQPDEDLVGKPTSLFEVLQQNLGQARRALAVKAYWQLTSAIGEYRFAREEEQLLARAGQPAAAIEQTLLEAAIATAAARRQETRVGVLSRQHALVEEALLPVLVELPWPNDMPLVGAYRTKFENLFAGQPQPIRLQQIDRALPHLLSRIEAQAQAVSARERAIAAVLEAYQRGQASLSMLLDTHDKLSRQRRQFLAAVVEYNAQIADYAVTVAGPSTPPDVLVSTLIAIRPGQALVPVPAASAATIRQTSAEEPIKSGPPFSAAPVSGAPTPQSGAAESRAPVSGSDESPFREVQVVPSGSLPEPPKVPQVSEPRPFAPGAAKSVLKNIRVAR